MFYYCLSTIFIASDVNLLMNHCSGQMGTQKSHSSNILRKNAAYASPQTVNDTSLLNALEFFPVRYLNKCKVISPKYLLAPTIDCVCFSFCLKYEKRP